jgi:DNA-binding CsgD family transcriptional regulator
VTLSRSALHEDSRLARRMASGRTLHTIFSDLPEEAAVPEACGVFGRGRELGAVAAFLDGLPSGPSGLLLEGEAGIGKTTVWAAGIADAAARSYLVLSSRAAESEATLSFAALGDLLDGVLERVLGELPAPQQDALQVALLLKDPTGSPLEHRAVCAAFLGVVRRLADQGPVVIAIDDLQWLDRPSAVTLGYALRRLGKEPVGLLASVRVGAGGPPASVAVARLAAGQVEHLPIGPLAPADYEAAIRASAGDRISRLSIRRLFEASGGNLFYGLELARALGRMDTELLAGDPLPVPAGLHGVLSSRVEALPAGVQDVLLAASCLQSPTTLLLERASGPVAWPALQAAAVEGVVEIEGARVRFTHPLLASAIYSGVAPRRRREAHRKLSLIAPNAEERARHRALSADGPDEESAADLAEAARAAAARGAPGAAAELAELAVARTPVELVSARRRRRLEAADYLFRAGDTTRARHGLEALAQDIPGGAERAETLLVLARLLLHDAGDLVAVPVLEEALAEASADRVLQARIHVSLARTCGIDLRYCARHAQAGLALARKAGDQGLARQALAEKLYADFMLGRDLRLERGDDTVGEPELEREPSAVEDRASTILGLCMVRADRFDEARRLLQRALQAAQEEGDESSLPSLFSHLADLECWAGNWQAAERYAAQGWDAGEQVGHRGWRALTFYARALIDAHLGRLDAARAEAAEGLSAATAAGDDWAVMMLHGVMGFAELSAGNRGAADASLSAAAALADRIGLAEPAVWRFHANHVESVIGLGDLDRAEALLTRLERQGHATGRRWTLASAARCRALLLAARGDTPGAERALDDALHHHQHLAMPFELARTLLVSGQVQRRARRKRLARQHLDQALGIFESLPAPTWAARARSELSRIGLRPPAPLELTATEERVAVLAASGHTNRQVAAALFLSPRTVEDNLARAYRKLGVSSRAELGAAMTRRVPARPQS